MHPIQIISGPAIGAVIGYFTNYIAVKMLFRPYKPVKIGNWTLPFTPGVIPRRKGDLARAIGNAIENNLLSSDDILGMLAGPETCTALAEGLWSYVEGMLASGMTLTDALDGLFEPGKTQALTEALTEKIASRTGEKLAEMDLGTTLASVAGQAVTQKLQTSMLGMFVGPDAIRSFLGPLAEGVNNYLQTEGLEKIRAFVSDELAGLSAKPIGDMVSIDEAARARIIEKIAGLCAGFMKDHAAALTAGIKTGKIVEDKINAMDVADFEKLVMSVMKHELSAVVNLGAVIGLVIGVINIFL
ncbi:MAG: DUF445 family protein [Clostridiales bacterium]|nr:DUF445 family protein [Clostridiales bacterium]